MKKLLSLVLVAILVIAMAVPAMAAGVFTLERQATGNLYDLYLDGEKVNDGIGIISQKDMPGNGKGFSVKYNGLVLNFVNGKNLVSSTAYDCAILGCKFVNGKLDETTCTRDGIQWLVCIGNCGDYTWIDLDPAYGHNFVPKGPIETMWLGDVNSRVMVYVCDRDGCGDYTWLDLEPYFEAKDLAEAFLAEDFSAYTTASVAIAKNRVAGKLGELNSLIRIVQEKYVANANVLLGQINVAANIVWARNQLDMKKLTINYSGFPASQHIQIRQEGLGNWNDYGAQPTGTGSLVLNFADINLEKGLIGAGMVSVRIGVGGNDGRYFRFAEEYWDGEGHLVINIEYYLLTDRLDASIDLLNAFITEDFSAYTNASATAAKAWVNAKAGELEALRVAVAAGTIFQDALDSSVNDINIAANIDYARTLLVTNASFLSNFVVPGDGFTDEQLVLTGNTLTLFTNGESFVLSTDANNKNQSGSISIGGGKTLVFDIAGNGSNVKVFEVI